MVPSFIVGFRETFEAALIIGVVLIYLRKMGLITYHKHIYMGMVAGIITSLAFGLIPNLIEGLFASVNKHVFNAVILYSAVAVMTSMLFFMHRNAKNIKSELETKTSMAIEKGHLFSLSLLAFVGVFREGLETVLFMWGIITSAQSGTSSIQLVFSCIAGGIMAVIFSWLFFNRFLGNFSLKTFFQVSALLILMISAGMFAKATGKLIKADLLSPIIAQVWDSTWLLNEKGNITGKIVSAMTGYVSKPSLLELLSYAGYILLTIAAIYREKIVKMVPLGSKSSSGDLSQLELNNE